MVNEKRKSNYSLTKKIRSNGEEIEYFTYIGCYRKPQTQNERKLNSNILTFIEDWYIAVRIDNKIGRRNRKQGLAHANNDISPDVYNKGKSWKHYSTRNHQYK